MMGSEPAVRDAAPLSARSVRARLAAAAHAHGRVAALVLLSLAAALPLWLAERPPIQDWPQHLAAVRVIHSYGDPRFGFERYFVLDLGRTQYLTVYVLADLLGHVTGVAIALKLVASAAIAGLPLSIAALARALGRAPSIALLALPLTYNAHLVLGFLNFVLGLPLMFLALAFAVKERAAPSRLRPWLASGLLVVCFYTHVVPFALAAAGTALMAVGTSLRSTLRRGIPLAVAALAAVPWLVFSPAGAALRGAAGLSSPSTRGSARPVYVEWRVAWDEIPRWLTDVWHGDWDRWLLAAWGALAVAWAVTGLWARLHGASAGVRGAVVLWTLPIASALAYFVAPAGYAWIWPINARFPLLALLSALPLIVSPARRVRQVLGALGVTVTVIGLWHVGAAALRFEREMGDLDAALERIPPASRVAGLIWDRGSRVVEFSPYLHAVAYYQAERGGAVMFTFADFPQSPFRFRDTERPPRVRPRWEWMPERVSPDRDLEWYDWVLTRGGPGALRKSQDFELVFEKQRWRVWRRRPHPPM